MARRIEDEDNFEMDTYEPQSLEEYERDMLDDDGFDTDIEDEDDYDEFDLDHDYDYGADFYGDDY